MDWKEQYREFDAQVSKRDPELLAAAKGNGLFQAFVVAVRTVFGEQAPKDLERFFYTVLATRTQRPASKMLRSRFAAHCSGRWTDFFVAQGVGMVFADRVLVGFVVAAEFPPDPRLAQRKQSRPQPTTSRGPMKTYHARPTWDPDRRPPDPTPVEPPQRRVWAGEIRRGERRFAGGLAGGLMAEELREIARRRG